MKYKQKLLNVIDSEIESIQNSKMCITPEIDKIIDKIINTKGKVIFTGIGKSAHIGRKISATFSSLGISSFFIDSNEALHGDLGAIQKDDIVICISLSGNTREVCKVIEILNFDEIMTIAMTGNRNSYMAKNCKHSIVISDLEEADKDIPAPTNSTTSFLVIGDALAIVIARQKGITKADFLKAHPGGSLGEKLRKSLEMV